MWACIHIYRYVRVCVWGGGGGGGCGRPVVRGVRGKRFFPSRSQSDNAQKHF